MNNTLRKIILSFLAERYPAAYAANAIAQRVNRSGMLDSHADLQAVMAELRLLASRFKQVELLVDDDGDQHWTATPEGVKAWQLDGGTSVGG
jgi:hypothetical protein